MHELRVRALQRLGVDAQALGHAGAETLDGDVGVAREALDSVAQTLNAVLSETRDVVLRNMATPDTAAVLALRAADWLKPLIARMAAVINGTTTAPIGADTQSAIDEIFSQ